MDDIVLVHILNDHIENQDEQKHQRRQSRKLKLERLHLRQLDVFQLPDWQFWSYFHTKKQTLRLILEELLPYVRASRRSDGISAESKIIVTIRALAQGSYQKAVGCELIASMSQPSVSRSVREVVHCINEYLGDKFVKFPTTEQQRSRIKDWFRTKYNIPGVIGCIDGTDIGICPPSKTNAEFPEHVYIGRKSYHSINVQIIVDHEHRILGLNAKFPGKMHDSDVWRSSRAREYLQAVYPNNHEWLLGDNGYPLEPWLLTPFRETQDEDEILYNELLCKARKTVVRAIGLLKGRWRCLCKESMLQYKPETCSEIINACAILHNICVDSYDKLPEDELISEEDDDAIIFEDPVEALQNEAMQNCREVIEYMRQHQ